MSERDPNAPIPPRSAWYFFCVDKREAVYRDDPTLISSVQNTARALHRQWTDVADSVRRRYEDVAEDDRRRYQIEMEQYSESKAREAGTARGRQQRQPPTHSSSRQPKPPRTAFMLFSVHHGESVKENNPNLPVSDVLSVIAEDWKALTPEARAPYERLAAEDKKRHEAQMEEYRDSVSVDGEQAGLSSEKEEAGQQAGETSAEDEFDVEIRKYEQQAANVK